MTQVILVWVFSGICTANLPAQNHNPYLEKNFEDGEVWGVYEEADSVPIRFQHINTDTDRYSGEHCERWIFETPQLSEEQRIVLPIPPARVIEELQAQVQVRSHCRNLKLMLRIRFPHQRDVRTGEPLAMYVSGDSYSEFTKWEQLACETSTEVVRSRLIRLRGQLASGLSPISLDERDLYVDQAVLTFTIPPGQAALQIDDFRFGPVVAPETLIADRSSEPGEREPVLTLRDDRILKHGDPYFPVFTIYHGESLDLIRETGVTAVWIPDYRDEPLMQALAELDIGVLAQPPRLSTEQAVLDRVGIPSFDDSTAGVWAWILGFGIPETDQRYVQAWTDQVRDADRRLRRPILADVAGGERVFHRQIDLLGTSRFMLHTALSPGDCFEKVRRKQERALPGKPMFTFVQTEPSATMLDARGSQSTLPVVEPEQILQQGYVALAAGFKGIGFWKQIPFDSEVPGNAERLNALKIFTAHCRILEPWLSSGRLAGEIPVTMSQPGKHVPGGLLGPLRSDWDPRVTPASLESGPPLAKVPIRASLLQSDLGYLILPVWYEDGAQCVPGPQSAQNVKLLMRGADTMQAWEITPTGISQGNLAIERVPGGTEITIREFDRHTAIVVTTHQAVSAIDDVRAISQRQRSEVAQSYVKLTQAKMERVQEELSRLMDVAPRVADPRFLKQANQWLQKAQRDVQSGHHEDGRRACERSLMMLRQLQRTVWNTTVDPLSSPVSSLDATCFATLEDHWRLMASLDDRVAPSENLLPSGGFDSKSELIRLWADASDNGASPGLRILSDSTGQTSHLVLMLPPSDGLNGKKAAVVGPEVSIPGAGTILITGRVRVPKRLPEDGEIAFYETIYGRDGALLWHRPTSDWQTFRMIRRTDGPCRFRIRMEVTSGGVAEFDDLQVRWLR